MNKDFAKNIIKQLELLENDHDRVLCALNDVSYYKLLPYITFIKDNDDVYNKIKNSNLGINNKWDAVVYIFQYNISLSTILYPFLVKLETILKTRINNLLIEKYSDYWFKDEILLLKANKIENMTDLAIYNKYKNIECKDDISKLIEIDYLLINDQRENMGLEKLSTKVINAKKKHIKRCCYLHGILTEALCSNPRITCMDFVENKVTFAYWTSLISINNWWEEGAEFKTIFPNFEKLNFSKSNIDSKLENIRILRNKISHYSRIIGKNQIRENKSLSDVYQDIKDIFNLLGINFEDTGCVHNLVLEKECFEKCYNNCLYVHEKEIKCEKVNKTLLIEMQEVNSSYLKKVGYDKKERIFQVEFNTGGIYQYYSVPHVLYEKFVKASSKGKNFINNIRDNFQYQKMQ